MKKTRTKSSEEKRLARKTLRKQELAFWSIYDRLKFNPVDRRADSIAIQTAIAETLVKLPNDAINKTIKEVIFIYMEAAGGIMTWTNSIVKLKATAIIFMRPRPAYTDSEIRNMIAHEIAHFILGHLRFKKNCKSSEIREREADDLAVKWGFKPEYKSYNPLKSR